MLLLVCLCSCSHAPREPERLERECSQALAAWQWQRLDSLTSLLEAHTQGPTARSLYYRAAYRPGLSQREMDRREASLADALRLADNDGDQRLLSSIYNTMAVYELARRQRYHTAQYYFNRAAELARNAGDEQGEVTASVNLSEVCRILGDTMGRQTDLRLYDYARRTTNQPVLYAAALHLAQYCLDSPADSSQLRQYLAALRSMPNSRWVANAIEARHALACGDTERAYPLIQRADTRGQLYSSNILLQILAARGDHARAVALADSLLANPLGPADLLDHAQIMAVKARSLAAMGREGEAYAWQTKALQWRDSASQATKMDQINRYRVEYQVAEKDFQIQAQEARLRLVVALAVAVAVVLLTVLAATLYYTRRRRQFYLKLVEQRLGALAAESIASGERRAESGESGERKAESREPLEPGAEGREAPGKHGELFRKILDEVDGRELWRDVSVTRETLAERLGTNRTYLSEAIKDNTGMSYSQFMNSRRIEHAVKVLADCEDDTPLRDLAEQLGFLSLKTFYTSFKQATGVPPAAFRQAARDLCEKAKD